MALSRRAKALIVAHRILTAARVLPSAQRASKLPVQKRLNLSTPTWLTGPAPEGVDCQDNELPGGGRVRLYRPAGAPVLPVTVYIHGGGWTVGGLASVDTLCRQLAHETQCAVLSVEYRLAPEHVYPAQLEDCEAALRWVEDNAERCMLDPRRVAVAGDSAGGNLAAAAAQRAHAADRQLSAQVLVYPAVDATRSHHSAQDYRGPGLSVADLSMCWDCYRGAASAEDPGLSPLLAVDLSGLPPALIITAGYDPVRDEGAAYARRLQASGIEADIVDYPNCLHGFLGMPAVFPEALQCRALIVSFLRHHLVDDVAPRFVHPEAARG